VTFKQAIALGPTLRYTTPIDIFLCSSMNPFGNPYQQHDQSATPQYLRPPEQLPPADPRHRTRAGVMVMVFLSIAWVGLAVVAQWYYARQVASTLQESMIESQRISESINRQVDRELERAGITVE